MKKNIFTAAALIIMFIVALAVSGCDQTAPDAHASTIKEPRRIKAQTTEVKPIALKDVLTLPGETLPQHDIRIAADQAGQVERVLPTEGDFVKKGDLLAEIDVDVLKTNLENAQASFDLVRRQYERRALLFKKNIISREELDVLKTEKDVRQGAVDQAQIAYDEGFVRAPIDGVVNHIHVDAGEFIGRGKPVIDIVNVEKIKVEVNVPELDVKYLKPGDQVLVLVDALPNKKFIGLVDFVAFKADPLSRTFRLRAVVDNSENLIRPGMIARTAMIKRYVKDAVTAPLFAILDKGGERVIFVEEEGKARSRTVSLGIMDGDRIQVTDGLNIGDRLIVSGHTEVEDGTLLDLGV